jgi:hypothetical protein
LTIVSVSFLVRFAIFETSSISSALVIVHSVQRLDRIRNLVVNLARLERECQPS